MRFQKFYIWFCSISWVVWLTSIVTYDIFWKYSIFDSTASIFALILALFSIIPTHFVFSVIALAKSIKAKIESHVTFNVISMIITFILSSLNFICCIVYYSGGA